MHGNKFLAVLTAAIILTGCGSMQNRAGVDRLTAASFADSKRGVVLLSTGAPAHCVSFATALTVRNRKINKVVEVPPVFMDAYVHKSEFAGHHGTINALQLEPGEYSFVPAVANPFVQGVVTPTFDFEVAAGEVVYLGELFMTQSCGMNSSFIVRDYYARDIEMAKEKNPELGKQAIIKRLLKGGSRSQ